MAEKKSVTHKFDLAYFRPGRFGQPVRRHGGDPGRIHGRGPPRPHLRRRSRRPGGGPAVRPARVRLFGARRPGRVRRARALPRRRAATSWPGPRSSSPTADLGGLLPHHHPRLLAPDGHGHPVPLLQALRPALRRAHLQQAQAQGDVRPGARAGRDRGRAGAGARRRWAWPSAAETPAEIAVSILGGIIAHHKGVRQRDSRSTPRHHLEAAMAKKSKSKTSPVEDGRKIASWLRPRRPPRASPAVGSCRGSASPAAPPWWRKDAGAAAASPRPCRRRRCPITLNVNGKDHKLKVEPRLTLLRALRNELDLTGTKEVCDRGACGACSVHLDGELVNSLHDPGGGRRRARRSPPSRGCPRATSCTRSRRRS